MMTAVLRSLEQAARIRAAAEEAALHVALGEQRMPANPYRLGTRENVLWTTSFHARLMELETEAFAPAPAVPACTLN